MDRRRKTQAEGAADQLKGKARNAMGRAKDAARDAADDLRGEDAKRDKDAA